MRTYTETSRTFIDEREIIEETVKKTGYARRTHNKFTKKEKLTAKRNEWGADKKIRYTGQ